jgi:serine/threonine protein kinase
VKLKYKFIKILGHGTFGLVRLAIDKTNHQSSLKFAIKTVEKNKMTSNVVHYLKHEI